MDHRPLEDWEFPEPDDEEDEDYAETVACPACAADVYEDAESCPACGEYIVLSKSGLSDWPGWFVALGLVGILAVILALLL